MNFKERARWSEALLACATVRDRKIRDNIIDELPYQISCHIERSDTNHIDVMNILRRILEFDDGLTQFIEIIRFYEGDTRTMMVVSQLYEQTTLSDSGCEEVAISNQKPPKSLVIDTADETSIHKQAISLSPSYIAHFGRGNVYREQGRYTEAIADYSRVIELKPDYVNAYIQRGTVYHNQGKYADAIRDYEQVIRLRPDVVEAYHNRGFAYHNQGKYGKAITDYDQAIQLKPDFTMSYHNRGLVYYHQGKYAEAIADYGRALQLNPNYANTYEARGHAYRDQGEPTKASVDYSRAIELSSGKHR